MYFQPTSISLSLQTEKRSTFFIRAFDESETPSVLLRWKIQIKSDIFCNFARIFASTELIPKQFKWRTNIENDLVFLRCSFFQAEASSSRLKTTKQNFWWMLAGWKTAEKKNPLNTVLCFIVLDYSSTRRCCVPRLKTPNSCKCLISKFRVFFCLAEGKVLWSIKFELVRYSSFCSGCEGLVRQVRSHCWTRKCCQNNQYEYCLQKIQQSDARR